MPQKKGSQAERRASKKQSEEPEQTPEEGASKADVIGTAKEMGTTSVIASLAPGIVDLGKKAVEETKASFKEGGTPKAADAKGPEADAPSNDAKAEESETTEENKENANEENSNGNAAEKKEKTDAEIFDDMKKKLSDPLNCLGLGGSAPQDKDAARTSWKIMKESVKERETNKKKKSREAGMRMKANAAYFMPQYLQIVFIWMCIRSLLFRSFFAMLPWCVLYQIISVMLPLNQADLPPQFGAVREKVPLDKVPVSMRIIISFVIHSFMWFFFFYEVVVQTYWLECILIGGLFAFHAYEVRPIRLLN